jgi:hypothetical protein
LNTDQIIEAKSAKEPPAPLACPHCGSESLRYEESHPSWREMHTNEAGLLVFYSHFEWGDGDDDPGVICDDCYSRVEVPEEVEVSFI